jgi:hypothetical protein
VARHGLHKIVLVVGHDDPDTGQNVLRFNWLLRVRMRVRVGPGLAGPSDSLKHPGDGFDSNPRAGSQA